MTGTLTGKFPKTAHLLKRADFQRVYQQGRRHFSGNMTVFYLKRPSSTEGDTTEKVVKPSELDRYSHTRRPEAVEETTAGLSCVRVGFTVPKALGKSVDRNRIRRRMREAVRHHLGELSGTGVDVVFNPKRSVLKAEFTVLDKEVERAFEIIRKTSQGGRKSQEGSR